MKTSIFFALATSSLWLLVACTTAKPPPAPTLASTPIPPTSTPVPPTDTAVLPSATPTATATEIALEFPTGEFYNSSGGAMLFLKDDGSYMINWEGGEHGFRGTYVVDGDQVTLIPYTAIPCSDQGVYKWTFDGEVIFFELIEDACIGRISSLAVKTGFKKK